MRGFPSIDEKNDGTDTSDISFIEAIITRAEISEWVESRDWTRFKDVKNIGKIKRACELRLAKLASRKYAYKKDISDELVAKVIAALADKLDPVGFFSYFS